MKIEDLSKTQLLTLTLLVNFVVSTATGIFTVSLLDQAPPTVTQTVNQIVDHTIETVTQIPGVPKPETPDTETQLGNAIAAASARTVSVHADATTSPALATGVYLPKSRAIATLASPALPKEVVIGFADGSSAEASLSHQNANIAIYGFADGVKLYNAPAASPVAVGNLRLGQTVIALADDGSALTGIISKINDTGIYTSLGKASAGAASVNLSGNLVGIASATAGVFYSADQITSLLTATTTPAQ